MGRARAPQVNVGGDLRMRGGPRPGESWTAGIRDPRRAVADEAAEANGEAGPHVAVVAFSRGGLATSGAVQRWWRQGGLRRHHMLDPRSGLPMPLWIEAADVSFPGFVRTLDRLGARIEET